MLWIAIHAVDKMHAGKDDSSVLYIPACPLTEANAEYLVRQREAFFEGTSPPTNSPDQDNELTNSAAQERQAQTSPPAWAKASI